MNFANPFLETEFVTSKVLQGIFWPDSYIVLRASFCDLDMFETIPDLNMKLTLLQKKIITSFGLLKDSYIENFYKGKEPELLKLIDSLLVEVIVLSEIYDRAVKEKLADAEKGLLVTAENLTSMEELSKQIDVANSENMFIQSMDATHYKLRKATEDLKKIREIYGSKEPIKKTPKFSKYSDAYRFYISDLYMNADSLYPSINLVANIFKGVDSIIQYVPKDGLDPFNLDKCENLVDILMHPEDYYQKAKKGDVETSDIANMFNYVYPIFMSKYVDMAFEDYDKLDGQEQVNFRKCFDMPADNSRLLSLCLPVISLGFKPTPVER